MEQLSIQEFNQLSVSERIELIMKIGKVSTRKLSRELGYDPDRFYKWAQGKSEPFEKDKVKLNYQLEKALLKYKKSASGVTGVEGRDETYNLSQVEKFAIPLNRPALTREYFNDKVREGELEEFGGTQYLIVGDIQSPALGKVDGFVKITDDRMAPDFEKGSLLIISRRDKSQGLKTGFFYFVVKNGKTFLCKCGKSVDKKVFKVTTGKSAGRKNTEDEINLDEDVVFNIHGKMILQKLDLPAVR